VNTQAVDGWNFAPELQNALNGTEPEVCHIVNKPSFGSYMLPIEILDELMAHNKAVDEIEKIVIYGYCTDICVISNAMVLRAAFPETEIEILSDCCAGVTPQSHQNGARRHAGVPVHNRIKRIKAKLKPTQLLRFSPHCVYLTPYN
jgi:Amidases related to nicotinamidase